jgi:osmoprotectant transport system ATP-binding protein
VTGNPEPAIRFENVVRTYAGGVPAVNGVSFEIPRGSMTVILGPSGCGKTTLLKTVNRLLTPTSGRVLVDGADVALADAVQLRRGIGYVIQHVGLFPHMTVGDNVAVVPALLGWDRKRIDERVAELLDLVHLPREFRSRYPRALSGGQQQRVGLARALAGDPDILLMDEPFGAVDAIERSHLQAELETLHARLRKSVLFVTHDVDEALRLADQLVIMRDGRVEQAGAPSRVLFAPANPFVADLVGADDVFRRLSACDVGSIVSSGACDGVPDVRRSATLREALSQMVDAGTSCVRVIDENGSSIGCVTMERIFETARRRERVRA